VNAVLPRWQHRLLGFAATLEFLLGSRLRTWTRSWRASTTDHGGATVTPPSLLELGRKPENQVLDATWGPAQNYLPLCAEDRGFAIAPSAKAERLTDPRGSSERGAYECFCLHRDPGVQAVLRESGSSVARVRKEGQVWRAKATIRTSLTFVGWNNDEGSSECERRRYG
jgi:hypothetical protein